MKCDWLSAERKFLWDPENERLEWMTLTNAI